MALLVVLVAKYDPVLPEIGLDMPVHNGSDKMHQQSTQQLLKNNTTKVDVQQLVFRDLNEQNEALFTTLSPSPK